MQRYERFLDLYDENFRIIPSKTKLDPGTATPAELAIVVDRIHQYNATNAVLGKTTHDPDAVPLGLLNTLAESVNIPLATDTVLNKFSENPTRASDPDVKHEKSTDDQAVDTQSGIRERPSNDSDVMAAFPLLTRDALRFQGFNISNLPPGDHQFFGATGRTLFLNAFTRQQLRAVYLLRRSTLLRMNALLDPFIRASVDISCFTDLSTVYPAAHVFQLLMICLANKTFHNHAKLTPELALLGNAPVRNTSDLHQLAAAIESSSTLANILANTYPFETAPAFLLQVLSNLQRGTGLEHFSVPVLKEIHSVLREFITSIRANTVVRTSSLVLRLAPFFPPPPPPPAIDELAAMLARAAPPLLTADPSTSADPEVAFIARQDRRARPEFRRYDPVEAVQTKYEHRPKDFRQARQDQPAPLTTPKATRFESDDALREQILQTLVAQYAAKHGKGTPSKPFAPFENDQTEAVFTAYVDDDLSITRDDRGTSYTICPRPKPHGVITAFADSDGD